MEFFLLTILLLPFMYVRACEYNAVCEDARRKPPNIVLFVADDLGWNDVSFHGSKQFLTPNIDALALSGVMLRNYYTQPICTPSRAALMTGRHPIHNGMESDVIYAQEPWGLPLTEVLLPEKLQQRGYATHLVGKWHLGFFKSVYTPTFRGFDSHYGAWLGQGDHYTHFGAKGGYDFRRDMNVSWEDQGKYEVDLATQEAEAIIEGHNESQPLFLLMSYMVPHAPLQAPQELIDKFKYIPSMNRRTFAAMVTKMDESIGDITQALMKNNLLNDTIIIFISDNGGATNGFNGNVASNFPLRGGKDTLWEGGVRAVGLVWSPLLQGVPRVHSGLVNVQDWLPTLIEATGIKDKDTEANDIDGVSQWAALNNQAPSPYTTMLHNIDPRRKIAAVRDGPWKIVVGRTYRGNYDGHYGALSGQVTYNLDTIKLSQVGRAVQETNSPVPDDQTVQKLREEVVVSCDPLAETPHVIQVRDTKYVGENGTCKPHIAPCLFNIEEDPCEYQNVALQYPDVVIKLLDLLATYQPVPPNNKPGDPRSYPVNWNYTWVPWMDFI